MEIITNYFRQFNKNKQLNVARRYFGKAGTNTSNPSTPKPKRITSKFNKPIKQKPKPKSEQSIFSRTAIFKLPNGKLEKQTTSVRPVVKKDVVPRKDFSTVKKLATRYLSRRRLNSKDADPKLLNEEMQHLLNTSITTEATTENYIKTTLHLMNFNHYLKDSTFDYSNVSKHPAFHEDYDGDKNVVNLLNELKSEVKHVDFDKKEKDLFDAKLSEIYDSLKANHFDGYFNNEMRNDSVKIDPHEHFDSFSDNKLGLIKKMPEYEAQFRRKLNKELSIDETPIVNRHDEDYDIEKENKISKIYGVRRRNKDIYRPKVDMLRTSNFYIRNDHLNEGLSSDRRRYYQEKLDNLERKLYRLRGYKRKNIVSDDRHVRPMKPPNHVNRRRFDDNSLFYMPDRARFLHGFK